MDGAKVPTPETASQRCTPGLAIPAADADEDFCPLDPDGSA